METYKPTRYNHYGRPLRALRIFGVALIGVTIAVVFSLLFGVVVMLLWNWLMPSIFGLKTITYWQGFGLCVLGKILFSGIHNRPHRHPDHFHRKIDRRWHRWMGIEDEDSLEVSFDGFSPEKVREFRSYWKDKGRSAFEEYLRRKETN